MVHVQRVIDKLVPCGRKDSPYKLPGVLGEFSLEGRQQPDLLSNPSCAT